ncbi:MAG: DegQ family serine endoprotease, partial [bacterium]
MSTLITFKKTTVALAASILVLGGGALGFQVYKQQSAAVTPQVPLAAIQAAPPSMAKTQLALPNFSALVVEHGPAVVNITVDEPTRKVALDQPNNPFEGTPFGEFFKNMPQPDQGPQHAIGSGFLISADGYLLTNAHVVGDTKNVTVKLTDKREFTGKVIGRDKATDVALVKIDAKQLPFVHLANPKDLQVGEWVVAIGSPYGFESTVTAGIVSAKGRSLPDDTYVPFIQTDVAVNPGNSGGPLFNMNGEVVGINSQIYSRSGGSQGLSFAIPIDIAQRVSDQLRTTGTATHGWLGVTIQEVTQDLANTFKLDKPRGALVSDVSENGPAKAAGIQTGDVILAFNGTPINSTGDLPLQVGSSIPGTVAKIDLMRDGKPRTLTIKIAALSNKDGAPVADSALDKGAKLGVAVTDLSPQQKNALGIDYGVQVQQVGAGPAANAGIQPGDIILQLGGHRIENVLALQEASAKLADGKPVALLIKRGEATIFVPITPNGKNAG